MYLRVWHDPVLEDTKFFNREITDIVYNVSGVASVDNILKFCEENKLLNVKRIVLFIKDSDSKFTQKLIIYQK